MAMAVALDDSDLVVDAAIHLELEYSERGDPRQLTFGSLAVELLEPHGPTVELGSVLANLGLDQMFQGNWEAALTFYERAARTFELCGHIVGHLATEINRLSIVIEQGRLDEALKTIDDLEPAATSAPPWFGAFLLATRGRAVAFKGDPDAGARDIRAALRSLRDNVPDRIVADTDCYLLEALVLGGRPVAAMRLGRRLIVTLGQLAPDQVVRITALRLLALAAHQNQTGDPGRDLDAALDLAREQAALIEVARILDAKTALLEFRGERAPRAWLAERRKILAAHDVVFEPSFPLAARS